MPTHTQLLGSQLAARAQNSMAMGKRRQGLQCQSSFSLCILAAAIYNPPLSLAGTVPPSSPHLDAENLFPAAYPETLTCLPLPAHFAAGIQSRCQLHQTLKYLPSSDRNVHVASPSSVLYSPSMAEQFGFSESVSRVTLDQFGPDGIRQLSRTFSRSSGQPGLRSVRSDGTLVPVQAHSLEKTLRATLDKYALLPAIFLIIDHHSRHY